MTKEKPEFIHPDDPKPIGKDQIRERKTAKREGRVVAPPRDELEVATETVEAAEPVAEVETGEPTPPEGEAVEGEAVEGEPPTPPEGEAVEGEPPTPPEGEAVEGEPPAPPEGEQARLDASE